MASNMNIKEEDAQLLFKQVIANDVIGVEKLLRGAGAHSVSWREVIRYELSLAKMLDTTQSIAALKVLHKLMAYEIVSMSSFHAAAMMGHNDIIVALLDKDIPVDMALSSGTTALHLASFAGETDTVKLLFEVYKTDINKQDNYGWSSLHYACTEGHKEVVVFLKQSGINIELRDKDGTTAAFRAQVNHHDTLVNYLCQFADEDSLLNIEESDVVADKTKDMYAKVNKDSPKLPPKTKASQKRHSSSQIEVDGSIYDRTDDLFEHLKRPTPKSNGGAKTLPSRKSRSSMGRNTIRRLIRDELESAFAGDYVEPHTLKPQKKSEDTRLGDLSLETLKAVMREELENFRSKTGIKSPNTSVSSCPEDELEEINNADDYEDLYATLRALPRAPSPPAPGAPGPPLPPRNPEPGVQTLKAMKFLDDTIDEYDKTISSGLTLSRQYVPNTALTESFKRLAPQLGENWKKLAHVLPIAATTARVQQRIAEIEKQHPDSKEKQAATALAEWRVNEGKDADVDHLIVALKRCSLNQIIPDVEKVTQEFTA